MKRRFVPDPKDPNNTIDRLEERANDNPNDPMFEIAFQLARIADALEPDENGQSLFSQVELIQERLRSIDGELESIKNHIPD